MLSLTRVQLNFFHKSRMNQKSSCWAIVERPIRHRFWTLGGVNTSPQFSTHNSLHCHQCFRRHRQIVFTFRRSRIGIFVEQQDIPTMMKNLAPILLLFRLASPSPSETASEDSVERVPPFASPLARLSLAAAAAGSDSTTKDQPDDTDGAQARIVGGSQSSAGAYPFYVQGDGCGGSLIWKDIVLTAGHCKGYWNTAWVGAYKYQSTSYGAEKISSTKQIRHPSYDGNTYNWDFMVVQLSKSSSKSTIRLNNDSSNPSGSENLKVIGLGVTSENSYNDPTYLREVTVANVPASTCAGKYDGEFFSTATMMCAASPGKDSCYGKQQLGGFDSLSHHLVPHLPRRWTDTTIGDSGGPIFDGSGVQVGVVSWGTGCV